MKQIIEDPRYPNTHFWEWSRAIRLSLSIAVRFRYDADQAQKTLDEAISNPSIPSTFQKNVEAWKKTVLEWKNRPTPTPLNLHQEADHLFQDASTLHQFSGDRRADILYLRAAHLYANLLRQEPDQKTRETLLLRLKACDDALAVPLPKDLTS